MSLARGPAAGNSRRRYANASRARARRHSSREYEIWVYFRSEESGRQTLGIPCDKDEPMASHYNLQGSCGNKFSTSPTTTHDDGSCYRRLRSRSEAPAPAGERRRRVPCLSDLSCHLFCPRRLLAPPHLRGLPLRLCSVAYCCQLVGQPVLLPRSFSFYLGLFSEERSVKICRLSFSS